MNLLINQFQRLTTWTRGRHPPPDEPTDKYDAECIVCHQAYSHDHLYQSPCISKHHYCSPCLEDFFHYALSTPRLMPLCCGRVITPDHARPFLGHSTYFRIAAEINQRPDHDPVNCYSCGWYFPRWKREYPTVTCEQCNERTCLTCRREEHSWKMKCLKRQGLTLQSSESRLCGMCFEKSHGGPCPDGSDKVFKLARKKKWKRCQGCWTMVEKVAGCKEVHCRCGRTWCYGCGNGGFCTC